jgi:hypothetical protein
MPFWGRDSKRPAREAKKNTGAARPGIFFWRAALFPAAEWRLQKPERRRALNSISHLQS